MSTDNQEKQRGRLSHPLSGADPVTLFRAFQRFGPPARGHWAQAIFASLASMGRLPFTLIDSTRMSFTAAPESEAPVFILGHWRSGTTHLYNILSRSPRFAFVTPYATGLPWDFLTLKALLGPILKRALPAHRYIDAIPVDEDSPQEDEIGIASMTTLSFYHALYFPKAFDRAFREGLFFDGVGEEDIARWQRRMRHFYAKLQRAQPGRRLLIKNPVYTARAGLLHRMWPEARFIHIHRNPYKVFFSMRNFYDKLFREFALQPFDQVDIDEVVLSTYSRMMDRLDRDREGIPEDQFLEMRFDALQSDPIGEIGRIYEQFGIEGLVEDQPAFTSYLESVSGYKKNVFSQTEADLKLVESRWQPQIDRWDYGRPE